MIKVYLASSWRNTRYPAVLKTLSQLSDQHGRPLLAVYDFRNPIAGNDGFHWSEIDGGWKSWTPEQYRAALDHPMAQTGFNFDMTALLSCDVCVLVMPCGRSAFLELGYAVGAGKPTLILWEEPHEPELMVKMCDGIAVNQEELNEALLLLQDESLMVRPPYRTIRALDAHAAKKMLALHFASKKAPRG